MNQQLRRFRFLCQVITLICMVLSPAPIRAAGEGAIARLASEAAGELAGIAGRNTFPVRVAEEILLAGIEGGIGAQNWDQLRRRLADSKVLADENLSQSQIDSLLADPKLRRSFLAKLNQIRATEELRRAAAEILASRLVEKLERLGATPTEIQELRSARDFNVLIQKSQPIITRLKQDFRRRVLEAAQQTTNEDHGQSEGVRRITLGKSHYALTDRSLSDPQRAADSLSTAKQLASHGLFPRIVDSWEEEGKLYILMQDLHYDQTGWRPSGDLLGHLTDIFERDPMNGQLVIPIGEIRDTMAEALALLRFHSDGKLDNVMWYIETIAGKPRLRVALVDPFSKLVDSKIIASGLGDAGDTVWDLGFQLRQLNQRIRDIIPDWKDLTVDDVRAKIPRLEEQLRKGGGREATSKAAGTGPGK